MNDVKTNMKRGYLVGYKVPIIILSGIYLGLFFILNYCIIENDISVSQKDDAFIIQIEKK